MSSISSIFGSVANTFKVMKIYPSTMLILISFSFSFFLGGGMVNWGPIFFNRFHAFSAQAAATYVGLAYCAGIIPGIILGGIVADRLTKNNPMWSIYITELTLLLSIPTYFCAFYVSDPLIAVVCFGLGIFFSQMSMGPILAAFNSTLPSEIRSTANAVLLLGAAIVSGGVANLLVGVLSDELSGVLGIASLRVGLIAVMLFVTTTAILCLFRSRRHYATDLIAFSKA